MCWRREDCCVEGMGLLMLVDGVVDVLVFMVVEMKMEVLGLLLLEVVCMLDVVGEEVGGIEDVVVVVEEDVEEVEELGC